LAEDGGMGKQKRSADDIRRMVEEYELANGRRIESSWRFTDAELVRLIRIAESA
jgi:hypothetical protein